MYVPPFLMLIIIIALLAAVLAALWQRIKMRQLMRHMNEMLDAAIDGSFVENRFDESMLSSVESRLDRYLSASVVSSRNLVLEKDKIKGLIADISHQTKTPIANILLYAQLLAEQDLPQESEKCVAALGAQAEKLSFLIASLVKLSRLETGILALHPTAAALQPMLDSVQSQYAPKAEKAGISLSFEATDTAAIYDSKWTAEALSNVIDNAIKYSHSGGNISVRVKPYQLFSHIDVSDDGLGIAEAEQAKVFSRFYRSPSVSGQEGVGIGLYLTRQILAEQGGYIKLKSSLGEGSVFSLFLPAI